MVIKKEWEVGLGNGYTAKVLMLRCSQSAPSVGDGVMVEARIMLPADSHSELIYDLQFGERVLLGGLPLTRNWGYAGEEWRWWAKLFVGDSASVAFSKAEEWVVEELTKLRTAIEERRKALLS
jgi:hypothetical protein